MSVNPNAPVGPDGRTYHLGTMPGSLAPHCLCVGSPERARYIAEEVLEKARLVGDHRGFLSFTGELNGVPMSVFTHGMGGPSMEMTLIDAIVSGARRFVRVGSSSSLLPDSKPGDICVWAAAERFDGVSNCYLLPGVTAVATDMVTAALMQFAHKMTGTPLGDGTTPNCFVGTGATTESFFGGQCRPGLLGYVPREMYARFEWLIERGCIAFEMEMATLFAICNALTMPRSGCDAPYPDLWCGGITAVYANRSRLDSTGFEVKGDELAVQIAASALHRVASTHPMH